MLQDGKRKLVCLFKQRFKVMNPMPKGRGFSRGFGDLQQIPAEKGELNGSL